MFSFQELSAASWIANYSTQSPLAPWGICLCHSGTCTAVLPGALSQLPAFPPGSFWPCLYLILSLPSINGFFLGMLCCFQEGYNFHFLSSAQRGASDTRQTSRVVSCCSAASFVKNCHYSTSIVPFPPLFLKKKVHFPAVLFPCMDLL